MNCKKCGNSVKENDVFCAICGEKIQYEEEQAIRPEPVSRSKTAFVCGLIGFILAISNIFYFYNIGTLGESYEVDSGVFIAFLHIPASFVLGIISLIRAKKTNVYKRAGARTFAIISLVISSFFLIVILTMIFSLAIR
ncbi:MAG: hypothetical protein ACOYIM_02940 [Bacilli bacterium]|jgi:uncharacterized membrane protein (DUF485 family)